MALKFPDMVSLLVAFLDGQDVGIVEKAAKGVALIASFNHGVVSSAVDSIPRLFQIAARKGGAERAYAVVALSSLSTNPENRRSMLALPDFLTYIEPLLLASPKTPLLRGANSLLSNVTHDNENASR